MMLTKLRTVVSYPVPQRSAMSTSQLRSTSVASMWPFAEHRHRLGERARAPEPHVSVTGRVRGEEVDELGDAAVVAERLDDRLLGAEVLARDAEAGDQEGGLAGAAGQLVEREGGVAR